MSDNASLIYDVAALIAGLFRECAAFETGLTDARKSELRKQLMILSDGKMSDSEFTSMLNGPNVIKPGNFLPTLESVAYFVDHRAKRIFCEAFEKILSAEGPPSEGATHLFVT